MEVVGRNQYHLLMYLLLNCRGSYNGRAPDLYGVTHRKGFGYNGRKLNIPTYVRSVIYPRNQGVAGSTPVLGSKFEII